ncbi:MAG: hypothetical protein WBP22_00840 [Candidatus Saccharimonas sp.]
MIALNEAQRAETIATIVGLALEVAQSIDWRQDDRLKSVHTSSGMMKTLDVRFRLENGKLFTYLLNNEGTLLRPAIVSRPVTLEYGSDELLVGLKDALDSLLTA